MTQLKNIPTPNTVDLGLPSGILWADSNIGAKNPWEPGMAFAWGETMFPHCADALFFSDDVHHIIRDDRYKGVSIRAVKG